LAEKAKVLILDDEESILQYLEMVLKDDDVEVIACTSAAQAIEALKQEEVALVISDNLMPGMKGVDFLERAKVISPDSVRIMLTGYIDTQAAMDAINKGAVYKFVTKPWNNDDLKSIVRDSISRYQVGISLRDADKYSLRSLAQTIELKDHYTKGHCDRVAKYALMIASALSLSGTMRTNIQRGSWLHDCGKIGVPETILNYPGALSEDQMAIIKKHPCWGADVARLAHLSQTIVNIVLYHHERFDGSGYPIGLSGEDIPVEARIVNAADIYDALTSERPYRQAMTREKAMDILEGGGGAISDPAIVDAFLGAVRKIRKEQDRGTA
jgi:response regulator RpfG family c-di-GMP phosphodiesterase